MIRHNNLLNPAASLGIVLLLGAGTAVAQGEVTLESLEQRQIQIDDSARETPPVDLEAARDNYRRLLELTDREAIRIKVKRRLADIELELAVEEPDPAPGARRAIDLYRDVLASSRAQENRGRLLYNVARATELAGDTAGAITALGRLIDEHPDSQLVPEARFRRAEMRFILGDYARAAEDYAWLVQRAEDSPFHIHALYKLGWARYRLGAHRESLDHLARVLQHHLPAERLGEAGGADLTGLSTADQEMVNDTLRALVLNFAQLGKTLTPGDFVDANAPVAPYEFLLYDRLFAHYLDKERFTDASETALAFAHRNPDHPEAKDFEIAAITALEQGGFQSVALERKQDFVQRYGIEAEPWYGKNPLDVPEVRERLDQYLDEITRTYHAAAQDSGEPADYRRAAGWYDKYLTVFPDAPDAPTLTYRRASTLYEAGDYAEAARVFERVAYEMADNEHATDAAYSAVLAWREAAGEQAPSDERVERATLQLAQTYPAQEQATAALSRLAEDRYDADRLAAADAIAGKVIDHEPPANPTQLANAWRIRAAAAMEAEDYATAETAYQWLLANQPESADRPAWRESLAVAVYRQAEALADAGKDAEAADEFLRLRDTVGDDDPAVAEIRRTAAFDAAAAAVRAGQTERAIELYAQFRGAYPRDEMALKSTRRLATLHLEAGNDLQAAEELLRLSERQDLPPGERRDAALQAARIYEEHDRPETAIRTYRTLLESHSPGFEDRIEALHTLVELYSDQGRPEEADTWRERLIQADAQAGDARSERSRTLAARATLALAEDKRQAVAEAPLTLPIKQSLPEKKERLEAALDAYGKAAEYDIADVTTTATFRIGQIYYDFSQELLEAPRPPDLTDTEAAQYEILLEEQAFPFEEKAIEIHQANLDRAADGLYNEWVRRSLEQLARLNPARYDRQERLEQAIAELP